MNVIKQDAYFWKVAYTLVIKQPYRVISLQTNELWLADDSRKKVIRLVRADFDWSNQLKTNMEMAFAKLDGLRTQLRWKTIEAETIYVAVLPPVDDWEHLVKRKKNHPNGKVQMNSYLIEQATEGYKITPDQMPLDLPNEHEVKGEEEYEKIFRITNMPFELLLRRSRIKRNKPFQEESQLFHISCLQRLFSCISGWNMRVVAQIP